MCRLPGASRTLGRLIRPVRWTMIRPSLSVWPLSIVLCLAAALVPGPARAQYNAPARGPVYQGATPPDSVYDDDNEALAGPGTPARGAAPPGDRYRSSVPPYREDVDAAPLPPPGLATPDILPSHPSYPVGNRQAAPAIPAEADTDAIRPPAPVGTKQGAVPQPLPPSATAALPPEDQPEVGTPKELPPNLRRQLVDYPTKEPAGTIVIDTPHTYLYLVLGGGKAIRYGIGVGREGFTWSGTERISKMKEWPDWFPPPEMIERQPYLPRMMAGGPGNPLGARALYLGHTLYRIHGTNQPSTIGQFVSSGCIRLLNEDIEDLYNRVQVGTRVVVLPGGKPPATAANAAVSTAAAAPPAQGNAAVNAAPAPTR